MLNLNTTTIVDPASRDNFVKISEFLDGSAILKANFKHYEIIFTQAETNKKIPHNLGFLPKDLIQTSKTGAGSITWNYSLFDNEFLDITTTDACVVRALIGRY